MYNDHGDFAKDFMSTDKMIAARTIEYLTDPNGKRIDMTYVEDYAIYTWPDDYEGGKYAGKYMDIKRTVNGLTTM